MKKACPRCGYNSLVIEPMPDCLARQVRCYTCEWTTPLKSFNKMYKKELKKYNKLNI